MFVLHASRQWHVMRIIPTFLLQFFCLKLFLNEIILNTTFNNGSLGSRIDEERSEMRYVMWIAEFSESSNLWTHIALSGIPESMLVWVSVNISNLSDFFRKNWIWAIPTLFVKKGRRAAWNAGAAGHSSELKAYLFSPVKRIITFASANIKVEWTNQGWLQENSSCSRKTCKLDLKSSKTTRWT